MPNSASLQQSGENQLNRNFYANYADANPKGAVVKLNLPIDTTNPKTHAVIDYCINNCIPIIVNEHQGVIVQLKTKETSGFLKNIEVPPDQASLLNNPTSYFDRIHQDDAVIGLNIDAGKYLLDKHDPIVGWKIHISGPENLSDPLAQKVLSYAAKNDLPVKFGRHGGQEGKELTLYPGSRDTLERVALDLEEMGINDPKYTPKGEALNHDIKVRGNVQARFDSGKLSGFNRYGSSDLHGMTWAQVRPEIRQAVFHHAMVKRFGEGYLGTTPIDQNHWSHIYDHILVPEGKIILQPNSNGSPKIQVAMSVEELNNIEIKSTPPTKPSHHTSAPQQPQPATTSAPTQPGTVAATHTLSNIPVNVSQTSNGVMLLTTETAGNATLLIEALTKNNIQHDLTKSRDQWIITVESTSQPIASNLLKGTAPTPSPVTAPSPPPPPVPPKQPPQTTQSNRPPPPPPPKKPPPPPKPPRPPKPPNYGNRNYTGLAGSMDTLDTLPNTGDRMSQLTVQEATAQRQMIEADAAARVASTDHTTQPSALDSPATAKPGNRARTGGNAGGFVVDTGQFVRAIADGNTEAALSSSGGMAMNGAALTDDLLAAAGKSTGNVSKALGPIGLGYTALNTGVNIARLEGEDGLDKVEKQGEAVVNTAVGVGSGILGGAAGAAGATALGATGFAVGAVATGGALVVATAATAAVAYGNKAIDDAMYGAEDKRFSANLHQKTHLIGLANGKFRSQLVDPETGEVDLNNPETYNKLSTLLNKEVENQTAIYKENSFLAPRWMRGWIDDSVIKQQSALSDLHIAQSAQQEMKQHVRELQVAKQAQTLAIAKINTLDQNKDGTLDLTDLDRNHDGKLDQVDIDKIRNTLKDDRLTASLMESLKQNNVIFDGSPVTVDAPNVATAKPPQQQTVDRT